jgi:hypothetical protein
MNRASYSRVPQSDADNHYQQDGAQAGGGGGGRARPKKRDPNVDVEEHKRQHRNRVEQCSAKVQALLWMGSAGFTAYSTDLLSIVLHDERVHRGWFNVGLFCFGIAVAMMLYAVVWLPYVKKIHYDVDVVSPRFIPVAAVVCTLQGVWCVLSSVAFRTGEQAKCAAIARRHMLTEVFDVLHREIDAPLRDVCVCARRSFDLCTARRACVQCACALYVRVVATLRCASHFCVWVNDLMISFCVGLWPVFGLFTPAVLGLVFMGALMSTHFIPYV